MASACTRDVGEAAAYLHVDASAAIALVGPPPLAGSEAQRRDLAQVHAAQASARDTPRRAQAIADSQASCARFADALGADVPAAVLPFLDRVAREASGFTGMAKRQYRRPRPFAVDAGVERLADVAPEPRAAGAAIDNSERDNTSYPSGHAAFGAACGLLLAGMVPERAAPLYERGLGYGESRVIVGAHFPRDVQAGQVAATVAMGFMQQDACYPRDYAQARAALRSALGLP